MLDPFAGSAVLCEAADEAGMRAVGFELDPRKNERLAEPESLFGEFDLATYARPQAASLVAADLPGEDEAAA